jgi:hypothetical protein
VAFDVRREAQQLILIAARIDQFSQLQACDRRSRAAPESTAQRNVTLHIHDQRWTAAAGGKRPEGGVDTVRPSERTISKSALEPAAPIVDNIRDPNAKIQVDGNSKRIETRTEIRDRRGDANLSTGAQARSYALHSPSMTSGLKA